LVAEPSAVVWLAITDGALLAAAGVGYVLMRRIRPSHELDVKAAFEVLDRSIAKYVPELAKGYTWQEAIERLRERGIEADWKEVEKRLTEYEAYRYGGKEEPKSGEDEIISLAVSLRRGVVGKGTKAKGAKPG
jgi:hypothetical protein